MRQILSFEQYLEKAAIYARAGDLIFMDVALENASRWSIILNQDISTQRTEIEHTGYYHAIPLLLAQAQEYAQQYKLRRMESYLTDAKKYASLVGEDISSKIREIRKITLN